MFPPYDNTLIKRTLVIDRARQLGHACMLFIYKIANDLQMYTAVAEDNAYEKDAFKLPEE
jgi:hypothetical protein